jgi:hypothetical protein
VSRIRKLVRDLDLLVGVCLAISLAVLGIFGTVSATIVSATTLVVLALLLTIFFRVREQLGRVDAGSDRHTETLDSIAALINKKPRAGDVIRLDYPDLGPFVETASEIWIVAGGSLRTTVGSYLHQFQLAVDNGAAVRLMCPNPKKLDLMAQVALTQGVSVDDVVSNIDSQLKLSKRLTLTGGRCEIRLADFLPTMGLVKLVRPGTPATIYVKMLPFSYISGAAPVLAVTSAHDEKLYTIFESVISRTWQECHPIQ